MNKPTCRTCVYVYRWESGGVHECYYGWQREYVIEDGGTYPRAYINPDTRFCSHHQDWSLWMAYRAAEKGEYQ